MLKEMLKKDYIQIGAIYEITFFLNFWFHLTLRLQQQQKKAYF